MVYQQTIQSVSFGLGKLLKMAFWLCFWGAVVWAVCFIANNILALLSLSTYWLLGLLAFVVLTLVAAYDAYKHSGSIVSRKHWTSDVRIAMMIIAAVVILALVVLSVVYYLSGVVNGFGQAVYDEWLFWLCVGLLAVCIHYRDPLLSLLNSKRR
jgi:hypothetical protein